VSLDPRPLFADVAEPLIYKVLAQYTPPLKEKHFDRIQSQLTDVVADLTVIEVDDRLVIDELAGGPVECYEVKRGGSSPYGVIITFRREPEV
jgi:hypothetical protein